MREPNQPDGDAQRDTAARIVIAAALALGLGLRSWALDRDGYWFDELCSIRLARLGVPAMLADLRSGDVHPPLFFLVLKGWTRLFGESESHARALPVFFGVTAIGAAAWMARTLWNTRVAAFAAVLVALSPFEIQYSRELRGYSLLLTLVLASTAALVQTEFDARRRSLARYVLLATLLPYTHAYGLIVVAAHGLYALARSMAPDTRRSGCIQLVTVAIVLLAFVPWVPTMIAQSSRVEHAFWLQRPVPRAWLDGWWHSGTGSRIWVLGITFGASVLLVREARRRPARALLLATTMVLPVAVPVVLSYISQPVFAPRTAIGSLGLLLVCAAAGLAPLVARWPTSLRAMATVTFVFSAVQGVRREAWLRTGRGEWRELGAFVREQAAREHVDSVIISPLHQEFVRFYAGPQAPVRVVSIDDLEGGRVALALQASERTDRFWLLSVRGDVETPAITRVLRARWTPGPTRTWVGLGATQWTAVTPQ